MIEDMWHIDNPIKTSLLRKIGTASLSELSVMRYRPEPSTLPSPKEKAADPLAERIKFLFDKYGAMPDEFLIDVYAEEYPSSPVPAAAIKAQRCLLGAARSGKYVPTDKGGRAVVWRLEVGKQY